MVALSLPATQPAVEAEPPPPPVPLALPTLPLPGEAPSGEHNHGDQGDKLQGTEPSCSPDGFI